MITEDYVSFEVSKLLKEKGFDEKTPVNYFVGDDKPRGCAVGEMIFHKRLEEDTHLIPAPTLAMAMKWLREKCIFITLNIISFSLNDLPVWSFDIWRNNNHEYRSSDYFDSYEQTCETAIKYCLKHLL